MFPISYKHPKAQADLHCVFMKPHIHSSTCDRKVAGGEELSAAELDLKPEGWKWVVVRWWRWAIWSSLSLVCQRCLCSVLCLVSFSVWNSLSCHWYGERFPIFQGPVPVLPGLWSSSCSPFLLELTAPSFMLPRTLFLFYYSTTMSSW